MACLTDYLMRDLGFYWMKFFEQKVRGSNSLRGGCLGDAALPKCPLRFGGGFLDVWGGE